MPEHTTYRLLPPATAVTAPIQLDDDQHRVVAHESGPLLVLAGPGTGKTTTLVEAIADRIERRGADPSEVLALTFSRKAAEQLRDRVTARLGRTTGSAMCSTMHSFAYGLIRRYAPRELYRAPLRLLSAPEQDVVVRELLQRHDESVTWPAGLPPRNDGHRCLLSEGGLLEGCGITYGLCDEFRANRRALLRGLRDRLAEERGAMRGDQGDMPAGTDLRGLPPCRPHYLHDYQRRD